MAKYISFGSVMSCGIFEEVSYYNLPDLEASLVSFFTLAPSVTVNSALLRECVD